MTGTARPISSSPQEHAHIAAARTANENRFATRRRGPARLALALLAGAATAAAAAPNRPLPDEFVAEIMLHVDNRHALAQGVRTAVSPAKAAAPIVLEQAGAAVAWVYLLADEARVVRAFNDENGGNDIGDVAAAYPASTNAQRVVHLVRHAANLALLVDHQFLGEWPVDGPLDRVSIADGPGLRLSDLHVQRTAEVEFGDNFAWVEDTGGEWKVHDGDWRLDISAHPGWSANAFRWRADGDGLATAGHWFWHHYGMRAAIRPGPGTGSAGIGVGVVEDTNGLFFAWSRTGDNDEPVVMGRFDLVQRVGGAETVLGSVTGALDTTQWYELAVITAGPDVAAFVDGRRLLQARADIVMGAVALRTRGADGARFDDVEVRGFRPGAVDLAAADCLETVFGSRQTTVIPRFADDKLMQDWSRPGETNDAAATPPPGLGSAAVFDDYTFDAAPVHWRAAAGDWDVLPRWACEPRWSWFGGSSHELAAVWSKRRYDGNQAVDMFSALMMLGGKNRPGLPPGYGQLGNMNLTICGDGQDLDSGYTLMLGGYGNRRTCIWRRGRIVAERDDRSYGKDKPSVHRRWFNIRGERVDNEVRFHLDGELILSYKDPEPLPGGHVAVWTWDNGLLLPRMRIWAERAEAPATPFAPAERVEFVVAGDAYAALVARRDDGVTEFLNPRPGGDMHADLGIEPFDARARGRLRFDYRLPPDLRVHLYLRANGDDFYVAMTAPDGPGEHWIREAIRVGNRVLNAWTINDVRRKPVRAGAIRTVANGQWQTAEVDLGAALADFFPHDDRIEVDELYLGNWRNDDYLMCGFGGNPNGARWQVRKVEVGRRVRGDPGSRVQPRASRGELGDAGGRPTAATTFATSGWRRAADTPPVRLAQPSDNELTIGAGPLGFGVVLIDRPFDAVKFPRLAFDYAATSSVPFALRVRAAGRWWTPPAFDPIGDGQAHAMDVDLVATLNWTTNSAYAPLVEQVRIDLAEDEGRAGKTPLRLSALRLASAALAADATAPTITDLSPGPGARAASRTVGCRLQDKGSGIDAASIRVDIGDHSYVLSDDAVAYDPRDGSLRIALATPPTDRTLAACRVFAADRAGNRLTDAQWQWTFDYAADNVPPGVPYVAYIPSRRLVWNDFETDSGEWFSHLDRTGRRIRSQPATGQHSFMADGYQATVRYTRYDAERYPMLRFDYRIMPGMRVDWVIGSGGKLYGVHFNLMLKNLPAIGAFADVTVDERWHRAEIDLGALLRKAGPERTDLLVDSLGIAAPTSWGRWYDNFTLAERGESAPEFVWSEPWDATSIAGYSIAIDDNPQTMPDETIDTREPRAVFRDLPPGVHYLHVRACDGAGNWGGAGHARTVVTPPRPARKP